MPTNTELTLSGSVSGKPISIAATASPGTLLHTATSAANTLDNLWIYVQSNHTAVASLTIQFGGITAAEQIVMGIPSKEGLVLVIPGLPLAGGAEVRAFADVANVLSVVGLVNRRTD